MKRAGRVLVATLAALAIASPLAGRALPRGVLTPPTPIANAYAPAWPDLEPTPAAGATIGEEAEAPAAGSRRAQPSCNTGRARWTRAEIRCAIRRAFPAGQRATALCVAWHESRFDPRAVGRAGERGLFQIHPVHRAWLGARWARLFDPAVNASVARQLQRRAGWAPWSTSSACTP